MKAVTYPAGAGLGFNASLPVADGHLTASAKKWPLGYTIIFSGVASLSLWTGIIFSLSVLFRALT